MNKSFSSSDDVKQRPSSIKGSNQFTKTRLCIAIAGILSASPVLVVAASLADGADTYSIQSGSATLISNYTGGNGSDGGTGGRAVAVSGSTQSVTNSFALTGGMVVVAV